MKVLRRAAPALLLVALASLFIPGPETLELYEVEDLVYTLGGFPGVDISLTPDPYDVPGFTETLVVGTDLAEWLEVFVYDAGDKRMVEFMNDHIIVRGTPVQQVAIRSAIATYRTTVRTIDYADARSRKLFAALQRRLETTSAEAAKTSFLKRLSR